MKKILLIFLIAFTVFAFGQRRAMLDKVGSADTDSFIITVKTDNTGTSNNDQFTLPATGTYNVDWGDGNIDTSVTGNQTHTYGVAGTYDIKISNTIERILFNNGGDKLKILDIKQWGTTVWANFINAYIGCSNLNISANDAPNLGTITTMQFAFSLTDLTTFNGLENWDVSNIISFRSIFNITNFNGNVSSWNVSSATDMFRMFRISSFDGNLSNWDITNVTDFEAFLDGVTLSIDNYNALLIGWEATLQTAFPSGSGYTPTITIDFGNSQYTLGGAAETARQSLIDNFGWTITDGGGILPPVTGGLLFDYPNASAAYSLRSLNTYDNSYDPDVVLVRRSSDDAELGFTPTEITDGTLETWATDQTSSNNNNVVYFENNGSYIDLASNMSFNSTNSWKVEFKLLYVNDGTFRQNVLISNSVNNFYIQDNHLGVFSAGTENLFDTVVLREGRFYDVTITNNVSTNELTLQLVSAGNPTETEVKSNAGISTFACNKIANSFQGCVSDFKIYLSDLTTVTHQYAGDGVANSNWIDSVGTNDGTIVGSPILFTGQGISAFVKTWYDQSGNSNHAITLSDTSQPILVSGGTLNLLNGKAVMNLDGVDDVLLASLVSVNTTGFNLNMVGSHTSDFGFFQILDNSNDGVEILGFTGDSDFRFSVDENDDTLPKLGGNQYLVSFAYNDPTKIFSINSSETTTSIVKNLSATGLELGARLGTNFAECQYQEVIYWDESTQIPNRADIKLNINTYYTIY